MYELPYELQKLFLGYEFGRYHDQLDGDIMSDKCFQISFMLGKIIETK